MHFLHNTYQSVPLLFIIEQGHEPDSECGLLLSKSVMALLNGAESSPTQSCTVESSPTQSCTVATYNIHNVMVDIDIEQ